MTGVYFVKAYAGVFGGTLPLDALTFDGYPTHRTQQRITEPDLDVLIVGALDPTLRVQADEQTTLVVKGRPHRCGLSKADANAGAFLDPAFLADLDGRFSIFCHKPGHFQLATDLFSAANVFWTQDDEGRVWFASHLGLLCQLRRGRLSPDRLGFLSVAAGGVLPGRRTPYAEIERLKAGEALSATRREGRPVEMSVSRYVEPVEVLNGYRGSYDAANGLAEYGARLREAVGREGLGESAVLMLSGGLDSSAIAIALYELDRKGFHAATYGTWRSRDVRGAKATSRWLDLDLQKIPYGVWDWSSYADFIVAVGGGLCGLQVAHNIVGFDRMSERFSLGVIGFYGDSQSARNVPTGDKIYAERAQEFGYRASGAFMTRYAEELRQIMDEIEADFPSIDDLERHQNYVYVDMAVRHATRQSNSFELCSWFLDIATPFYSRDLIGFMFNLPASQALEQRFYRDWHAWKRDTFRAAGRPYGSRGPLQHTEAAVQDFLDQIFWRFQFLNNPEILSFRRMFKKSEKWLRSIDFHCDAAPELSELYREELAASNRIMPLTVLPIIQAYNKYL